MRDDVPDATLWLEAVSGTESSFAELFDRHRVRVFRKAYARVRNVSDAEDIVAVVFLEAWRSRQKVRIVDGSILPWLYTVTTNVTLNSERSTRRYRRLLAKLPPSEEQADHADDIARKLDGVARANKVKAALRRLGPVDRTIIDLCILDDLPLATVATVLDLPLGTVKSRLHRARKRLRIDLAELDIPFRESTSHETDGSGS